MVYQWKFKRESGLFFTPVWTLWSGLHIGGHVWRLVIVPLDLAQSCGTICMHYCYHMIHRSIIIMRVLFSSHRKSKLYRMIGLSYKKKKNWRYNNSAPYVTPRLLLQQIPLKFPWVSHSSGSCIQKQKWIGGNYVFKAVMLWKDLLMSPLRW